MRYSYVMNEAPSHLTPELQSRAPTILIYGTPDQTLITEISAHRRWGLVVDSGLARDPVFTVYENFARADAFIALPDAHPIHLLTLLAEAEVGHPLMVHGPHTVQRHFTTKTIIFLGSSEGWESFRATFAAMRTQGLVRDGFDRLACYESSAARACKIIADQLPSKLPLTRVHYYLHTKKRADLEFSLKKDVRPPAEITVACFGSASTTNPAHLERTDQVAKLLAKSGYNILHGGGSAGVMGQLSASGAKYKAFVKGVTVHSSGAPKIFFERTAGDGHPHEIDLHIASKDMLHRIETYAGHSEAFVALDGGLGSAQEVLVIAELIATRHPVVMYRSTDGNRYAKPLIVLNESGVYGPLLLWLQEGARSELLQAMHVVTSPQELETGLEQALSSHPPLPRAVREQENFRDQYAESELPEG